MIERLMAALSARLQHFLESGDPSQILELAAMTEAGQLWEANLPADRDPFFLPVDVTALLAMLHLSRYHVLPVGQDQPDLQAALDLYGTLKGRAPGRIPDEVWRLLSAPLQKPADDAAPFSAEGVKTFDEYDLADLYAALDSEFGPFDDAADLDEAIDALSKVAAATGPRDPGLPAYLSSLGRLLVTRFERARDSSDLDDAIQDYRRAVAVTAPDDPDRAIRLSSLGTALFNRFRESGEPEADLDDAIDAAQQAVDATGPDQPGLAVRLSNLGDSLRVRFERTGDLADADAAIDAGRQSLAAGPDNDPRRGVFLSNLSASLLARFEHAGDDQDLDATIDAAQQAVSATAPDDPDRAWRLSNLGCALLTRFEQTGDGSALDEAVDAGRQSVAFAPPDGPAELAACLSNLGNSLRTRFDRDRDAADLDAAIDAGQRAVAVISPDRADDLAMYLANVGASLLMRFERTGDGEDLDAAIDAAQRAVTTTRPGHPSLAGYLSNQGTLLRKRFEETRDAADLDAAIDAYGRAVAISSPGHPGLGGYLSNLAISLHARFGETRDAADLDAAIDAGRKSVAATHAGHPNLAKYLSNLGIFERARFDFAGDRADLDTAIGCWRQASRLPTGMPGSRMAAAQNWAYAAADSGLVHMAADGYEAAVGLLPTVAWHGLDRATREEQLAEWAGLATDAAACAVLDGRPELAVELLEQGRSVLWTQALTLRGDLGRLAEQAPVLAEQLTSIRDVLDRPVPDVATPLPGPATSASPGAGSSHAQQELVEVRRRIAREWDDVLAQVRALDGFEHFLAAIPYPELAPPPAAGGPVVVVNASTYGCHALIVSTGNEHAQVVNLPDMSLTTTVENVNVMQRVLAATLGSVRGLARERDRHALLDVLDWMWDVIAAPVLTELGHTGAPRAGDQWPRVWWCPTGALTLLPIHAAGHHPRLGTAIRNADSVLDRVISSYTPTLTALARSRQLPPRGRVRQLTVGLPTTPGLPALPAVPSELEVLANYFPPGPGHHQLTGSRATRDAVLTAIATHYWAHLACHASQEHDDPAHSGFALWDGALTITDLAGLPTQRRDLAFLSACQTATGGVRHLDEAIHLSAAMQFLGYRHVIATMWTIADSPAPHVAGSVYGTLTQGGGPDSSRSAEALHQAIHSLRRIAPTNPLLWAPYIHLGP